MMNQKTVSLGRLQYDHQIPLSELPVHQGSHCPMHVVLSILRRSHYISSLVVGTPECATYSRLVVSNDSHDFRTYHYSYVLDENEVVFGCEEGVRHAVEEMIREGAEALVIIKTCIPGLIGEDFNQTLDALKSDIPVMVLDLAHFKMNGYGYGYEAFFKGFAQWTIDQTVEARTAQKQSDQLTDKVLYILGDVYPEELMSYFSRPLPKQVHIRPENMADHMTLLEDGLLLVTSGEWSPYAQALSAHFGWDVVNLFDIYDSQNLKIAYSRILGHWQSDAVTQESLNQEFEEMKRAELTCQTEKETLKIEAYIGASDLITTSLAYALDELGVKVNALHIEWLNDDQRAWKERCLAKGFSPEIAFFTSDGGLYQKQTVTFAYEGSQQIALKLSRQELITWEQRSGLAKIQGLLDWLKMIERRP